MITIFFSVSTKTAKIFSNYHVIKQLVAHPAMFLQKKLTKFQEKNSKASRNRRANANERVENGNTQGNGVYKSFSHFRIFHGAFYFSSDSEWWWNFVKNEHLDDINLSYKLILLFGVLEQCEKEGDKL